MDLSLEEHRDGATMRWVSGIVMNERVQGGKRRHRLQCEKDQEAKPSRALSGVPNEISQARHHHHGQEYD